MLLGVMAGGGYLLARFGVLLPIKSAARVTLSAAALYGLSAVIAPASKLMILVQLMLLPLCYLAALVLTGELSRADFEKIKKVISR
jgi:hypothetical protein